MTARLCQLILCAECSLKKKISEILFWLRGFDLTVVTEAFCIFAAKMVAWTRLDRLDRDDQETVGNQTHVSDDFWESPLERD